MTGRARWRWLTVTVALAVTMLGVPTGPGSASPDGTGAAAQAAQGNLAAGPPGVLEPGGTWTVTLITGDVVDVRSDADGRAAAAPREPSGPFQTVRMPDGELYVIPSAVTPLLDGVLDLELFNVTGLVRQGYDDESIDVVPLIVQRQAGVDVQPRLASAPDERPLPSIGAVATEVAKGDAAATGELLAELAASAEPGTLAAGGITRVWLDRQVTVLSPSSAQPALAPAGAGRPLQTAELDPNLTQVGADRAWAAGLTGEGVTVAVLDTGVDGQHPDLAGQVVAEENFSSSPDTVDRFGHGTHVASIAAGTGAASEGARQGVAPDARLISGKVIDDFGFGLASQAIAGMEWAAPQADVVNVSLGYGSGSDGSDPISLAVDALTEQHDTLFVIAAGNSGPASRSIDFPGAADRALTVGAVDTGDALADFSSRGPLAGSYELKPEVVAPGVDIVAAWAAGTTFLGDPIDDHYVAASGTSMATPHAAGAAAVLAQQHPEWTADQLKNAIVGSSDPVDGDGYDVGAGRIDVGDGIEASLVPGRDVVDASLAEPRDEPHAESLTWTNTGDEPQTVSLDVELEDRQGDAVEAVTVEPAELVLAPGATGTATLTIDGGALDVGLYSGIVTADPAGGPEQDDLRTPVAVFAEPEMVDLTIEATPPPGVADPPLALAVVANLDDLALFGELMFFLETTTLTVPAGRYAVLGNLASEDFDTDVVALVGDPDVTLTEDTTVAFDGAAAVPFHPTVHGADTAPPMYSSAAVIAIPQAGAGGFGIGLETFSWTPMPPIHLTPMEAPADVFAAFQVYRLQAPHLGAEVAREPISVTTPVRWPLGLPEGATTLRAVDVGDGSDLSAATGELAVVRLPADRAERAAIVQRALDADVALLAFADPERRFLTVDPFFFPDRWVDGVSVIVAADASATRLLEAASAGEDVTVTLTASPFVYDIQTEEANVVDPEPVLSRREQRQLATLDERFHRDPDGSGGDGERRYAQVNVMNLDAEGPLPERRTAHVTPGVEWLSIVFGPGSTSFGSFDSIALSMDAGRVFEPRSRQTVSWLRRPLWPGPVGTPFGGSGCQPPPSVRTPATVQVFLAAFQDDPDRYGCTEPHTATLTLERDGTVIGTADQQFAEFPVPAEAGTYRLSYEQATSQNPYDHRSSTTWTFRSAAPQGGADEERLALLVVDYDLPLDTLNQPTRRHATFTVQQVTGAEPRPIDGLQVWTSTDGGTTWHPARARSRGDGEFRVTLPRVEPGTAVSLRVDATDSAGNRIEQTLYDAYVG